MNNIWVALYYDFEAWFKINFQDYYGIPNVVVASTCMMLPNCNVLFAIAICSNSLFSNLKELLKEPVYEEKELGIWSSLCFCRKFKKNLHSVDGNYTKIQL
jgi:hypothetical protein